MSFSEHWEAFLWGIENTVQDTVGNKQEYKGLDAGGIEDLIGEIMEELRSDDALHDIQRAAEELDETTRGLLTQEIKLWSNAVDTEPRYGDNDRGISNDNQSRGANSIENPEKRMGQAQTVKDSVEKLLNLPSWISKPLEILNEVLGLIT